MTPTELYLWRNSQKHSTFNMMHLLLKKMRLWQNTKLSVMLKLKLIKKIRRPSASSGKPSLSKRSSRETSDSKNLDLMKKLLEQSERNKLNSINLKEKSKLKSGKFSRKQPDLRLKRELKPKEWKEKRELSR